MSSLRSRRSHTKSRGGCSECKRRKIKCEEGKPICAGCIKRETASGAKASLLDALPTRLGLFDMEDMTLWHHFIKSTAATISTPWAEELPVLALSCDYLMHGILAAGALHLVSLEPDLENKYSYLSTLHLNLALGPFHQATKSITPENANQLFAFSTLLVIFNFASSSTPSDLFPFWTKESQSGILNWMTCLRGCYFIIDIAKMHIEAGPLGFLITESNNLRSALGHGVLPSPEDDKSLNQITEGVMMLPQARSSTTLDEMDAYMDAIAKLRTFLAASTLEQAPVMRRAVTSVWAVTVSETFLRLLGEKRPPAMIIMAHYCILLKRADNSWYIRDRGLKLLTIIGQSLSHEWAEYIKHPRRIVMALS
ncbi:hypothetical protein GQ53DRAFT_862760 [Thozetella sp. PMI_491]|nr:hypothetical protein GQ53DRAFT_862760 [Thozetella sp. PMI_491]